MSSIVIRRIENLTRIGRIILVAVGAIKGTAVEELLPSWAVNGGCGWEFKEQGFFVLARLTPNPLVLIKHRAKVLAHALCDLSLS